MYKFKDSQKREMSVHTLHIEYIWAGLLAGNPEKLADSYRKELPERLKILYPHADMDTIQIESGTEKVLPVMLVYMGLQSDEPAKNTPQPSSDFLKAYGSICFFVNNTDSIDEILEKAGKLLKWDDYARNTGMDDW